MNPTQAIRKALAELKSIHQGIGAVGVSLGRCKPGSKRTVELENQLDTFQKQSWDLSETISDALAQIDTKAVQLPEPRT